MEEKGRKKKRVNMSPLYLFNLDSPLGRRSPTLCGLVPCISLHKTQRVYARLHQRQLSCLLFEACAIGGKQRAALRRVGNVVCDGVEVDGFLSGVAVHRWCTDVQEARGFNT